MNKQDLLTLLHTLGVRPSRKLGQNFLIDPNMLDALVRDANPGPGETILEIGPGTGALTRRLLAAGCRVVAIELDARLYAYLEREFAETPELTVLHADACRFDYDAWFRDRPYRCIANLPYSCSSVFLARVLEMTNLPATMSLLLQREMADRLTAAPGTRTYGALSARLQLRYQVTITRPVPPQVFYPAPEVASACVRLVRRPDRPPPALLKRADELTRAAFRHRRKKLIRLLAGLAPPPALERAFATLGLDQNARAEQLHPDEFVRLAACLDASETTYCDEDPKPPRTNR